MLPKIYCFLFLVAPDPRPPRASEKIFRTILPDGSVSEAKQLPCWQDEWEARKTLARRRGFQKREDDSIDEGAIFMSVVVPSYNEEKRLGGMLEEAVAYLQRAYGDAHGLDVQSATPSKSAKANGLPNGSIQRPVAAAQTGWEILIVSDGSKDRTVETALNFARDHQLSEYPAAVPGPWAKGGQPTHIPHGSIRVISLEENRGKGGAVTHGMRHIRGKYAVFADADGASKFDDLEGLVKVCEEIHDKQGRSVGIGSRSHLVGSEAVVKVGRSRLLHAYIVLIMSSDHHSATS